MIRIIIFEESGNIFASVVFFQYIRKLGIYFLLSEYQSNLDITKM